MSALIDKLPVITARDPAFLSVLRVRDYVCTSVLLMVSLHRFVGEIVLFGVSSRPLVLHLFASTVDDI